MTEKKELIDGCEKFGQKGNIFALIALIAGLSGFTVGLLALIFGVIGEWFTLSLLDYTFLLFLLITIFSAVSGGLGLLIYFKSCPKKA